VNCTLAEAEAEFVPAYNPSKPTRRGKIWLAYQNYLNDLRQIIGTETNFFQWLDGSFIGKKVNPSDLDMVTFLSETVFSTYEKQLEKLTKPLVAMGYGEYLDAYIVPQEQEHLIYWEANFSRIKNEKNKLPQPLKKGFIQINF